MAKLIKIHLWYGDEINDWEKLWNPTVWVDPLKLYVLLRLRLIIFQTRSVSRFILHILQIHPVKAGHKHPLPLQIMHHNQCLFKQTSVIPSKHGLFISIKENPPLSFFKHRHSLSSQYSINILMAYNAGEYYIL